MKFYKDGIFHVYNQGNNCQQLFYSDENYHFFIWKMKMHLLPFGDLLSWCLMPNHFHWQLKVNSVELPRSYMRKHVDKIEWERRNVKYGDSAMEITRPANYYDQDDKVVTLNQSIGIIQSSYARAINHQFGCSGSLFRGDCKSKNTFSFNIDNQIIRNDHNMNFGMSYTEKCFLYIHNNPVEAGLVKHPIEYPWSSAREYSGSVLSEKALVNIQLGKQYFGNIQPKLTRTLAGSLKVAGSL